MCINSVATSSFHFILIFFYASARPYHSNLHLFLVVNEIKCKYGNNSRLKSRLSFPRNNTPLNRIMCRRPLIKGYGFLYITKV